MNGKPCLAFLFSKQFTRVTIFVWQTFMLLRPLPIAHSDNGASCDFVGFSV